MSSATRIFSFPYNVSFPLTGTFYRLNQQSSALKLNKSKVSLFGKGLIKSYRNHSLPIDMFHGFDQYLTRAVNCLAPQQFDRKPVLQMRFELVASRL